MLWVLASLESMRGWSEATLLLLRCNIEVNAMMIFLPAPVKLRLKHIQNV